MSNLEEDNLGRRITGMKTSDKMTDKQIVAQVHGHFLKTDRPIENRSLHRNAR
jgi:hypothetical protein